MAFSYPHFIFGFLPFFNKALFVLKSALLIQFIYLKRTDVEQI